jgi:T4 RnlA family RNA ligase
MHRELRGITFVEGRETPWYSIKKFWNLNENDDHLYDKLKNKEVRAVLEKADGSLIQIIQIDGELVCKTKMSFDNEQAKLAQEHLDKNPDLKYFVLDMHSNNWQPLFELVSPWNTIVLEYPETELRLIAVRDEEGHFIPLDSMDKSWGIPMVKVYDKTLDDVIQECKDAEEIEGFVIRYHDKEQTMIKVKSSWYFERHRLSSDADRYSEVLKNILNDTLDDILSVLPEVKRNRAQGFQSAVVHYVTHKTTELHDLLIDGKDYDRKTFAIQNNDHEYFSVLMSALKCAHIDIECVERVLKEYLLKKYSKEEKAKNFILSVL